MSGDFSKSLKREISQTEFTDQCCAVAFLSAVIHTAGSLIISNKRLGVLIKSGNAHLKDMVFAALLKTYAVTALTKGKEIYLSGEQTVNLLIDLGIIKARESLEIIAGIDGYLISRHCCKSAYIKGAFMGAGSISVPTGGYQLEFSLAGRHMANDLTRLLGDMGIMARIVERKDKFVVYIKGNETVSDTLALLGASKSVLELNNLFVSRQVRQQSNRRTNCDLANMDKAINAGVRQAEKIERIFSTIEDKKLRETAEVRIKYKDASYDQLATMLGISKSGLKHRLKKLEMLSTSSLPPEVSTHQPPNQAPPKTEGTQPPKSKALAPREEKRE